MLRREMGYAEGERRGRKRERNMARKRRVRRVRSVVKRVEYSKATLG